MQWDPRSELSRKSALITFMALWHSCSTCVLWSLGLIRSCSESLPSVSEQADHVFWGYWGKTSMRWFCLNIQTRSENFFFLSVRHCRPNPALASRDTKHPWFEGRFMSPGTDLWWPRAHRVKISRQEAEAAWLVSWGLGYPVCIPAGSCVSQWVAGSRRQEQAELEQEPRSWRILGGRRWVFCYNTHIVFS